MPASDNALPRHVEHVEWSPSKRHPPETDRWPYSIPAVAQIIADGGLDIPPGITILVGENGSGKSTIIEALAAIIRAQVSRTRSRWSPASGRARRTHHYGFTCRRYLRHLLDAGDRE